MTSGGRRSSLDKGKRANMRGAAVIVASRPLEPAEAVTDIQAEGKRILPALIRAGQVTFIERVIILLQLAGVAPIVVITGFENEELERLLSRMSVVCLHNPRWQESSFFDDAIRGLFYAQRTCRACDKILLASPLIPSIRVDSLTRLLKSDAPLALPVFEGQDGLPLVFSHEAVSKLTTAASGRSLADLIALAPGPVDRLDLDDQGVLSTFGSLDKISEDLTGLSEPASLPMRARIKLNLARETVFFGPGPATLLRLIDETGSVRTACIRMRLSYSKGWQILNLLEEELGAQVLDRRPGGQEGGRSLLTSLGRDLLQAYEAMAAESQKQVNRLFQAYFQDFQRQLEDKKTQG